MTQVSELSDFSEQQNTPDTTRHILWKILVPSSYSDWFGTFSGLLSILTLIKMTLGIGLSATFTVMLDYYDKVVEVFIASWAEPIAQRCLAIVNELGWDLRLYPHWKHISVLVGLYLFRSVLLAFSNRSASRWFRLIEAIILAFLSGVASGLVLPAPTQWLPNVFIGLAPILAICSYGVFNGWFAARYEREFEKSIRPELDTAWKIFHGHTRAAFRRTLVAIILLPIGVWVFMRFGIPGPGLAMLAALVLLLALHFLNEGVTQAKRRTQNWRAAYLAMDSTKLGGSMIRFFVHIPWILLTNAGLSVWDL
jgi:hypothetical protein